MSRHTRGDASGRPCTANALLSTCCQGAVAQAASQLPTRGVAAVHQVEQVVLSRPVAPAWG